MKINKMTTVSDVEAPPRRTRSHRTAGPRLSLGRVAHRLGQPAPSPDRRRVNGCSQIATDRPRPATRSHSTADPRLSLGRGTHHLGPPTPRPDRRRVNGCSQTATDRPSPDARSQLVKTTLTFLVHPSIGDWLAILLRGRAADHQHPPSSVTHRSQTVADHRVM